MRRFKAELGMSPSSVLEWEVASPHALSLVQDTMYCSSSAALKKNLRQLTGNPPMIRKLG
jgi:hypothetical protein